MQMPSYKCLCRGCGWQDLSLARVKVEEAKEELVSHAVYEVASAHSVACNCSLVTDFMVPGNWLFID